MTQEVSTTTYLQFFEEEIEKLNLGNNPFELYEPITYILSLGGKRMRPVVLLLTCDILGGDYKKALPQALAIELFHNFTLMHDDIMDAAPKRRNQPTVHHKWDENTAILSGDVMLVCAYQQLAKADNELLPGLLHLFNQTAVEVCEGQQFDMNFETETNVSIEEYIKMIELKTAVLLGCSLKAGAIMANANTNKQDQLYEFGRAIGIAFQLQDDLLDVYGNPDKFGKQVGGDILANKKTFLYLKSLELANDSQKETLLNLFSNNNIEPSSKIKETVSIFNALEIKSHTEELISNYHQQAVSFLNNGDFTEDQKNQLLSYSDKLMVRES